MVFSLPMQSDPHARFARFLLLVVVLASRATSLQAQLLDDAHRGPTIDGTPGLFRTWDAEPLRAGEVFMTTGVFQTHRDPGEMTISTVPAAMAIGVHDRLELFGMWEIQKRIEAPGIETYRIAAGEVPHVASTLLGEQLASSAAPFMDVPIATGRSELYGYAKLNILSERTGQPFALSAVGTGKIPGHKTATGLNRGLSTGDTEVGFGTLISKRLPGIATLHLNTIWVIVAHPQVEGVGVSDLQNRFVLRGGAAFPLGSAVEGIAEIERTDYFFHQTVVGLNPTIPVDVVVGLRAHPSRMVSVSAGYTALVNRIEEDPQRAVRPAPASGFVVQLGLAFGLNPLP